MSYINLGGSKYPVGYCKLHRKTLSVNQMTKKKCLKKECWYLVKYEDNPFWKERAKRKAQAKANRQAKKERECQKQK